jgi:hypothetical protein
VACAMRAGIKGYRHAANMYYSFSAAAMVTRMRLIVTFLRNCRLVFMFHSRLFSVILFSGVCDGGNSWDANDGSSADLITGMLLFHVCSQTNRLANRPER